MAVARPVLVIAGATFVIHAAVSARYGFHRDELYFLAAGDHPAFGYADQPPFTPLLGRAITAVTGPHLWPLRVAAGAVHGALVVIAALIARELGGRPWAQAVAAFATALCPFYLAAGALFHTTAFDMLAWAVILLLFVRAIRHDQPKYWLGIGVAAGLALQNKWMPLFLLAGIAVAAVGTPQLRRHLRSRSLWIGAAIAVALWLPNMLWSNAHDWPGLEVASNNDDRANGGQLAFVFEQIAVLAPALLVLAVVGTMWMWRQRRWRSLAIMVIATELALLVVAGKAYYVAGLYVVPFAAGAVAAEEAWSARRRRLLVAVTAAFGTFAAVLLVPFLPARTMHDLHIDKPNDLYGEELGWPELADQVAAIYRALPSDEKPLARILTGSYGEAAAIQWYGPARGVPADAVLSGHNSYAYWWPDDEPLGTLVAVRIPAQVLEPYYTRCDTVGHVTNELDIANEVRGTPIVVCRQLTARPFKLRDAFTHLD